MKYRSFGRLGWNVAEIGFGAWAVGGGWGNQSDEDSRVALHRALDLGCNFIDTAQGYGDGRSERIIAQVLKERHGDQRVYVATKIPPAPGSWPPSPYDDIEARYSAAYLRQRLERSLRELRTECIDLLQLHTWTRAWNRNPTALATLRQFKQEGKVLAIGVSTPEHDQDSVLDLMRGGWVDSVQLIYNIFEQEPQAELLPAAVEHKVAVIVRVAFDEGALTGKLTPQTVFAEGDFRQRYFAGDRLQRTVDRVEAIRRTVGEREPDLATAALKFALKPAAVSTVISGIRNTRQADMNLAVSAQAPMSDALEQDLRAHTWRRNFWFAGK
ncbi:MAG TPA: aldo/keto reductase [Steroidobacteraceae bacterium]